MPRFIPVPGLDELVARMIATDVEKVGKTVEKEAGKAAPPTKRWVTMRDSQVRHEHRKVDAQEVPENLRFELPSHPWDREHRGLGVHTYMRFPRDETSRAVVNIAFCRCQVEIDPEGIAKHTSTGEAVVEGRTVTVTVACDAPQAVDAEFGTVYPGGLVAFGTRFMGVGVARAAARSRGRR